MLPAEVLGQFRSDVFRTFGVPGVYHPPGGADPVPCTVVLIQTEEKSEAGYRSAVQTTGQLRVRESEVGLPAYQGTFEVEGEIWTVVRILSRSVGIVKLEVRQDLAATFRK